MAENSGIEWTHHTFNPWIGCTKVSPACDFCYAEEWDKRYEGGKHWGPKAPRRRTSEKNWNLPLKWDRKAAADGVRLRVFCASLADVFDNKVPAEWRDDLWAMIRATPNLDWLLLTKRPQNIAKMLPADWADGYPNVWLGTTVENQEEADRRIPPLLDVPARIRFLSCEPLLGRLNLGRIVIKHEKIRADEPDGHYYQDALTGDIWDDVNGIIDGAYEGEAPRIHWVITGGESGPNFRPADPDWFRALRDECIEAETPFLFKQWEGASQQAIKKLGRELDGKIWDQYPAAAK